MLAKLVRFYGLPPRVFTEEMSATVADQFVAAMPYLEALETMQAMQVAGFPQLDSDSKKKMWRRVSIPVETLFPPRTDADEITVLRRTMIGPKGKKRKK